MFSFDQHQFDLWGWNLYSKCLFSDQKQASYINFDYKSSLSVKHAFLGMKTDYIRDVKHILWLSFKGTVSVSYVSTPKNTFIKF